jgi:hypothetical protein
LQWVQSPKFVIMMGITSFNFKLHKNPDAFL